MRDFDPLYRWNRKPSDTRTASESYAYIKHNKTVTEDMKRRTQIRRDLEDKRFLESNTKDIWEE